MININNNNYHESPLAFLLCQLLVAEDICPDMTYIVLGIYDWEHARTISQRNKPFQSPEDDDTLPKRVSDSGSSESLDTVASLLSSLKIQVSFCTASAIRARMQGSMVEDRDI